MRRITFELCAETIAACVAARDGGAHRIELCSHLELNGLSPSPALVSEAIARTELPIHAMVRPHPGSFTYSAFSFAAMRSEILQMKRLGAAGVVLGVLHPNATIDIEHTRALVLLAHPMQVTFHRAFDVTPALSQALEDVIAAGCHRILTSGGKPNVLAGTASIAALIAQAGPRIDIAAGGGLRLNNAASVARLTKGTHFHGSLRRLRAAVDPQDIRALIHTLSSAI